MPYILPDDTKIISRVIDTIPDYCTVLRGYLKVTDILIRAGKVDENMKIRISRSPIAIGDKLPSYVETGAYYSIFKRDELPLIRKNHKESLKHYISEGMVGDITAETERTDGIGRCVGETMHIELGSNSQLGAYGAGNLSIVWLNFNEHYGDAVAFEKLERDIEAIGLKKFFK